MVARDGDTDTAEQEPWIGELFEPTAESFIEDCRRQNQVKSSFAPRKNVRAFAERTTTIRRKAYLCASVANMFSFLTTFMICKSFLPSLSSSKVVFSDAKETACFSGSKDDNQTTVLSMHISG